MSIDATNNNAPIHNLAPSGLNKAQGVQPAQRAGNERAASAEFHASRAIDSSQDIDHARVAAIRQAISDGSLTLRSDRIADAIVASARELIGQ